MDFYVCKNLKSAISCDKNCIINDYVKFSIVKKDEISTISFVKKRNNSSGFLKNCKIENVNNWLCQELDLNFKTNSFNGYKIFQMVNGIFSFQSNLFSKSIVDN